MSHTHTHTHLFFCFFFAISFLFYCVSHFYYFFHKSFLDSLFTSYFPNIPFSSVSFYGYNGSYGSSPYRLSSVILSFYYSTSTPNHVVSLDTRSSYDNYGHTVALSFRAYLPNNSIPVYGTLPVSGFNFSEFLNFKVGGASFLSLLIGSGIFIYMGWAVVKWFLPS